MTVTTDTSHALSVLKETIGPRPDNALAAQPTGVRLVNVLQSTGWPQMRKRLTIEEVIQLSAVVVCLDVISQDIAKVTFRLNERLPGGGSRAVDADEHPMAMLLATEPNPYHTWYEFHLMVMLHLGLVQNAFIAKRQAMNGVTEELIPCMPARTTILAVEPEQDPRGRGFYAYEVLRLSPHEKIQLAQLPTVFLQDEFIHMRGRMFDGLAGYSNLIAGARTFGLSDALLTYQTKLFANDAQLRGVFQMGKESGDSLSDTAFQRLREQLAEAYSAFRETSKPLVLEEGMSFQDIAMNAEQAEVKEAKDAAIVDVARTFRIPPHKIMHLINVKYENMETLEKSYVNDSLIPYCQALEQRYNRSLLTKEERAKFFFQFDRREMLLNDPEKLAEVIKVLLPYGAVEHDEARAWFGFNPLPNNSGKTRLLPANSSLIDSKSNKVLVGGTAAPASDAGGDKPAGKPKPKKDGDDVVIDLFPKSGEA